MLERRLHRQQISLPISQGEIQSLVDAGGISVEQARSYLELVAFRQGKGNRRTDFPRPMSHEKQQGETRV